MTDNGGKTRTDYHPTRSAMSPRSREPYDADEEEKALVEQQGQVTVKQEDSVENEKQLTVVQEDVGKLAPDAQVGEPQTAPSNAARKHIHFDRIYRYAFDEDFFHKIQVLPQMEEFRFYSHKSMYNGLPAMVGALNPQMLYIGGNASQNLWAFLEEFESKDQPAEVHLEIETFVDGQHFSTKIEQCGEEPYMDPFQGIASGQTSAATKQLTALVRYLFLSRGAAVWPHVFGEAVKFPELKDAIHAVSEAYESIPMAPMHGPANLSKDYGPQNPDEAESRTVPRQLSHPKKGSMLDNVRLATEKTKEMQRIVAELKRR